MNKENKHQMRLSFSILLLIAGLAVIVLGFVLCFMVDMVPKGETCLIPVPGANGWIWQRIKCDDERFFDSLEWGKAPGDTGAMDPEAWDRLQGTDALIQENKNGGIL